MARQAPNAAPLEVPSTPGDTSGLRNTACSVLPETDSAMPTSRAVITRGRRIWITTRAARSLKLY